MVPYKVLAKGDAASNINEVIQCTKDAGDMDKVC